MEKLLLGVDVGTSSTKGVVTDLDGRIVSTAVRSHRVSMPHTGWAEHDPLGIWWNEFCSVTQELAADRAEEIAAVCVSGIGPCLLPARANGEPLRPAILYGNDVRATAEIADLNKLLGADEINLRCGSPLTSQSIGPKLLWLRRHEPAVWKHTRRWFMTNGYLVYRLTGHYVLDRNSASQATPLYGTGESSWVADWCETVAPGLDWPELLHPTDVAGTVTDFASNLTGLAKGTPVVVGTTDAWAEACSAGATAAGDAMVMYGSSMVLIAVLACDTEPASGSDSIAALPGLFAGQTNLVASLPTAGAIAEWLRDVTSATHASLIDEAIAAGPSGLLVLPYFGGMRSPTSDPFAKGAILGLTLRHTRAHLYRAVLEGNGYAIRHNLEATPRRGATGGRLIAAGGGTQGRLAVQITSDITGLPQEIPRYTIGACHGDALLAGLGTGLVTDPHGWNPVASVVTPLATNRRHYDDMYACYLHIDSVLRGQMGSLASAQVQLT
jgi:xylulokinase